MKYSRSFLFCNIIDISVIYLQYILCKNLRGCCNPSFYRPEELSFCVLHDEIYITVGMDEVSVHRSLHRTLAVGELGGPEFG